MPRRALFLTHDGPPGPSQMEHKVTKAVNNGNNVTLTVEPSAGGEATTVEADVVLVAIGRRPYTEGLGLKEARGRRDWLTSAAGEKQRVGLPALCCGRASRSSGPSAPAAASLSPWLTHQPCFPTHPATTLPQLGVAQDKAGRVLIDPHTYETNVKGVYAIGDITAGPMLAHKAEDEGVAVAELLAGRSAHMNMDTIPSIIYTDPEVAWVGKTEEQARGGGCLAACALPAAVSHRAGEPRPTQGAWLFGRLARLVLASFRSLSHTPPPALSTLPPGEGLRG